VRAGRWGLGAGARNWGQGRGMRAGGVWGWGSSPQGRGVGPGSGGSRSRLPRTAPARGARVVRNRGRATEGVPGYYRVFDDGPRLP